MFNRSINKVVLVGNLGKDPEVRYLPNGNAVANFSIATTERWKNKQTGQYESSSEWHNIVVYGKLGELCGQHLKKGKKVLVEGKLKTRKWQDKQTGQDRYATEIIASEIENMDQVDSGQQQGYQQQGQQQNNQQSGQPQPQQSWGNAPQQHNQQPQQNHQHSGPAYQHPQQNQQQPGPNHQQPHPQHQQMTQSASHQNR